MRLRPPPAPSSGQVLVGVLLVLLVLATLVPVMVLYTQREAVWTEKQHQSNTAFHLAEAGIEKAYRKLTLSTSTWYGLIESGTAIPGFQFDTVYGDVPGGTYKVDITSGPDEREATIVSIGRDAKGKEVRAIEAVFVQNSLGNVAIQTLGGVQLGGGVDVEWGAVISEKPITTGGRDYPQFHSAGSIDVDANGADPPNCDTPDCCQWFSYSPDIPPDPGIDLNFYRSSASATTSGCPSGGVGGSCYYNTPQSWGNKNYTGGGTIFIENNLTVNSPGINIVGNLIVTGNLSTTSGNWGKGTATPKLPREAWKQYCNDWTYYRTTFDGAAPASFPGLNSDYLSADGLTYSPSPNNKFAVQGLLYVGGSFSTSGGGGNSYVHGTMFVVGTATMTSSSGVTVFYNRDVAQNLKTTKIILNRKSWKALVRQW